MAKKVREELPVPKRTVGKAIKHGIVAGGLAGLAGSIMQGSHPLATAAIGSLIGGTISGADQARTNARYADQEVRKAKERHSALNDKQNWNGR